MIATLEKPARVNPVYAAYFADPFVWRWETSITPSARGRRRPPVEPLGKSFRCCTPPTSFNGILPATLCCDPTLRLYPFLGPRSGVQGRNLYLYYSVGHGDKDHQLHVAASNRIQGPYKDCGAPLLAPATCPFAIDAHPFKDDDGHWYLFYARLSRGVLPSEGRHRADGRPDAIGYSTRKRGQDGFARALGLAALSVKSPYVWPLLGLASLEGPCVRKHHGRSSLFLRGGRWDSENYGVDYGVADHVAGPYSDAGNEAGPRVLRTVRGRVIGPGHNLIVVGPDGKTGPLVYHAWDRTGQNRLMCMDKLVWASDGPQCEGPTWVE